MAHSTSTEIWGPTSCRIACQPFFMSAPFSKMPGNKNDREAKRNKCQPGRRLRTGPGVPYRQETLVELVYKSRSPLLCIELFKSFNFGVFVNSIVFWKAFNLYFVSAAPKRNCDRTGRVTFATNYTRMHSACWLNTPLHFPTSFLHFPPPVFFLEHCKVFKN